MNPVHGDASILSPGGVSDSLGTNSSFGMKIFNESPQLQATALSSHSRKIKPAELLYDVRRSVSEILGKPFTERIDHRVFKPDQRTLALWAADCAERVLPYFEEKYPSDDRPRRAIETLHAWIDTGVFKMSVIRKASLDAHAAARKPLADGEKAACFAAHAAGQAVGTAHVPTHALGSSIYGIRAVTAHSGDVDDGVVKERDWQLQRLRERICETRL